ncbi:hypothetical protein TRIUR3_23336 [Triticum urartu]|uniref:Uncharacterized protein n=1 Tax=Triticum urartu TaxID=4572 RepID=M7ZN45_TRIUA|nr:hypothetical protein TRIUR3_23336 [Triticum urartu]
MVAGGLTGTELVSTGGAEAGNNPRTTGRGKKKALTMAREKKPLSYRKDRPNREEFMRALREEEPIELREEDEIPRGI